MRSPALLIYVSASQWLLDPGFGPVVLAIIAAGIAYLVTAVMAGVRNRRALFSALTTAGVGVVLWFPLQTLFDREGMNLWWLFGLGIVAIGRRCRHRDRLRRRRPRACPPARVRSPRSSSGS